MGFVDFDNIELGEGPVLSAGFNMLSSEETAPSVSPEKVIELAVNTPSNSTPSGVYGKPATAANMDLFGPKA